jgi:AcrR family transcriptional regulator
VVENAVSPVNAAAVGADTEEAGDVAARIAARTLAKRGPDYTAEVRRLLDAALEVIAQQGTTARARVADIVAAAGLSNDAFYRHFPSKDALIEALIEDGALRLASYASHQMEKETTPEGRVRRWVEAVLAQTEDKTAATPFAVLWNGSDFDSGVAPRGGRANAPLASLLHEPLAELGSADPALHASLVAHAVLGKISDHLWARSRPTRGEREEIVRFCLAGAAPAPPR